MCDEFGFGDRTAVDDLEERVEQQREALAARVDDAGVAQDRQQVGCARDGVARGSSAPRSSNVDERRTPCERFGGLGDLAHDGEDRAFDRAHDGLVRGVGRVTEAVDECARRYLRRARDTSSARPRRICDRMTPELPRAPMSEPRLIAWQTSSIDVGVGERGADRLERERHVGAGVAVGDRVDVEPVQLLLVRADGVAEPRGAPGAGRLRPGW